MFAKPITYFYLFLACVLGISGCATRATQSTAALVKPTPVKKIVLVMVMEPPRMKVENRGSVLLLVAGPGAGYLINKAMEHDHSYTLTTGLQNASLKIGEEMSAALRDALAGKGYEVSIITDVKREAKDPDSIVYESINTDADAILSARFSEAGLFCGQFSTNYVPRLNLDVEMLRVSNKVELYSQTISYGADARKPTDEDIPADPKYAYGSFELAMNSQAEIAESFRTGIRAIANRIALQVRQNGI